MTAGSPRQRLPAHLEEQKPRNPHSSDTIRLRLIGWGFVSCMHTHSFSPSLSPFPLFLSSSIEKLRIPGEKRHTRKSLSL